MPQPDFFFGFDLLEEIVSLTATGGGVGIAELCGCSGADAGAGGTGGTGSTETLRCRSGTAGRSVLCAASLFSFFPQFSQKTESGSSSVPVNIMDDFDVNTFLKTGGHQVSPQLKELRISAHPIHRLI